MPPVDRNRPVRAKSSESTYSLMEFMREFPDDATCLEWLWVTRYAEDGEHAECPKCEQVRPFKRYETGQQRQSWTCTACGHHIHPTAGTVYHKSSTSLHLWFYAIYLITSTRCGISAKQLERELGVTYKTAWRMFNLIRNDLMEQPDGMLDGTVEMDEAYVGGQAKWRSPARSKARGVKRGIGTKTPVYGLAQRGTKTTTGKIRAEVAPNLRFRGATEQVEVKVLPGSIVYTDEAFRYEDIDGMGYLHSRVNHSERIYVSGDVHTNTIEGFWALLKGGIGGTYHSVSTKWLQGYLNEYAWRYNHRDEGEVMFRTLLHRAAQQ